MERPQLNLHGPIRSLASGWVHISRVLARVQGNRAELSPAQEIRLPQDSVRRFVWGHVIPSREEHGCKLLRKPQVLNNSLGIQTCQETREAGPWGAAAGIARAVTSQPLNLPVIET